MATKQPLPTPAPRRFLLEVTYGEDENAEDIIDACKELVEKAREMGGIEVALLYGIGTIDLS